jgi:hypothetical protein
MRSHNGPHHDDVSRSFVKVSGVDVVERLTDEATVRRGSRWVTTRRASGY